MSFHDLRKRIFEVIESATENDKISHIYDIVMMIAIVASLVPLAFKTETVFFKIIDKICVVLATAV